jgi:L-fuculose-phosphate aldolase
VPPPTDFPDERAALAVACRRLAAAGLVIGTAGNVSVRAGAGVLLTPTGMVLADVGPDDATLVDLDGAVVAGRYAPTSELALHLGIYRTRPDVAAVTHAHALASVAFGCTHDELPALHYAQLALGGTVRVAPFAPFGTPELAHLVGDALADRQAAFLANHGSVAVGPDLDTACAHLELLEWLAELYTRAAALGEPRALDERQLEAVRGQMAARRYGAVQPVQGENAREIGRSSGTVEP